MMDHLLICFMLWGGGFLTWKIVRLLASDPLDFFPPNVVPGCFYRLTDGSVVRVVRVWPTLHTVIYESGGREFEAAGRVFVANATLVVTPKPPPAPKGAVSIGDA